MGMKKGASMKLMKKRKSKVAHGKLAKAMVFRSSKAKTGGGLAKDGITRNKRGKYVSKKASANGKKNYSRIAAWTKAVKKARAELNIRGFVAVNGKTAQGKALYKKAKEIMAN